MEKLQQKLKFIATPNLVVEKHEVITLVIGRYAAVCPFQPQPLLPGEVQGSYKKDPGLCQSTCPFFELEAPTGEPTPGFVSTKETLEHYRWSCKHSNCTKLIDPGNITDLSEPVIKTLKSDL